MLFIASQIAFQLLNHNITDRLNAACVFVVYRRLWGYWDEEALNGGVH